MYYAYCGECDVVDDLMFSTEVVSQTHQSVLEISRNTGIWQFVGCQLVTSFTIFSDPPIKGKTTCLLGC